MPIASKARAACLKLQWTVHQTCPFRAASRLPGYRKSQATKGGARNNSDRAQATPATSTPEFTEQLVTAPTRLVRQTSVTRCQNTEERWTEYCWYWYNPSSEEGVPWRQLAIPLQDKKGLHKMQPCSCDVTLQQEPLDYTRLVNIYQN